MKIQLTTALIILSATYLFGQESKYDRIFPFDSEKFEKKFNEKSPMDLDKSLKFQAEATLLSRRNKNSMPLLEIQKDHLPKMPNMSIRKDINYTMQIKKYDLQFPFVPDSRIDSLFKNDSMKVIPITPK